MTARPTYSLSVVEAAVKTVEAEGVGPVTWLISLCYETQNGVGMWVGTVFSVRTGKPVRVGKRGEWRRLMRSPVEAHTWYRRTA